MSKWVSGGMNTATTFFDSFVPEMWTEGVRYYFRANLVLGNLATDWSDVVAGGGDIVHIPRINEQAATTLDQGAKIGWTANTTSESKDDLVIDTHAYSAMLLEDVATIQASDDLMAKYSNEMGYALAKAIDTKLDAALSGAGNSIELGAATGSDKFGKADFGTIVSALAGADVDYLNGNVAMVLKPNLYSSLFELDEFARADVIGNGLASPRYSGYVGQLVGIPVYVSTQVDAGTSGETSEVFGYVFDKSALNIAFSKQPRLQEQYDIDYLGTKVVTDCLYGTKLIGGTGTNTKRAWKIVNAS